MLRQAAANDCSPCTAAAERSLWGMEIEVDGGISPKTAPEVVDAGATALVAGAAVFNREGTPKDNIAKLRASFPHTS